MYDVAVTYIMREFRGAHQVLLGEKLTGLGIGKIVAPGGKSEPGESPRHAAAREIGEEVGLHVAPEDLHALAVIDYPFVGRPALSQRSHVFRATNFSGQVVTSSELEARWWPLEDIPYSRMWADAPLWLPRALAGAFIEATIHIGEDDGVLSHDIPRA